MYKNNCKTILVSFLCLTVLLSVTGQDRNQKQNQNQNHQEIFEQDLTDSFKIDESANGIQKVNLKCGSNSMHVQLETEKDFSGVMYTRGSFYKQTEPCFVKPKNGKSRSLEMQFTLDQCQTQQEGDVFSNIVVIQNDPELVTPGDSAFSLECDFRRPRNIEVGADMQARERTIFSSRITLTSPDPSAVIPKDSNNSQMAFNKSNSVTFVPVKKYIINEDDPLKPQIIEGSVEEVPIIDKRKNHKNKDEL